MCGIAGMFHFDGSPASSAVLKHMTDAIRHRGPDGEGHYVSGVIGLGHRRLSIIDLSEAGYQPMHSDDGRYSLVYNGETYNFQELRSELQSIGARFRSRTDSEVVLQAIAHWGVEKALPKFNGMFAFAVYDKYKRKLVLARDRYGIKPLYYALINNVLIFASEAKAILEHPSYIARLDKAGLVEYLTFQNFFTDRTLFTNVRLLPAGCYVEIFNNSVEKKHEPNIRLSRYWDYNFQVPQTPHTHGEYLEELEYLFRKAVNRQLVADVDVGSYLSGGMDSGSITAVAAQTLPFMRTFTCGFDLTSSSGIELSFDERTAAEHMSYLFKTEHYEMVLKSGDMERAISRLAFHLEEPRVGQSYPNFYIAQLASKFNKVVLAGTGGDELFGGYPWRYYRAVVNADFDHYLEKYYSFWQRLIPRKMLQSVFAPIWNEVKHVSTQEIFRDVFSSHADQISTPEDYVNHSLYFESKTFLHGLLVVEDKLSMAHSLETRVPFLDNDLVDFAMRLPANMKLGNLGDVVRLNENTPGAKTARYFQKTHDGKLLLREMMKSILPPEIVEREKQGFSAPDASWFKGESIDYVRQRLLTRSANIYKFLDYGTVAGLLEEHLAGRQNRRLLIWSLLNLEELMDRYDLAS